MESVNCELTLNENHEEQTTGATKEKMNLFLFAAGKMISLLGSNLYSFAISLYILKVTGSGTSFAFSILISVLPRVILSPFAGSLSDRGNRKKLVITMDFLSGFIVLAQLLLVIFIGIHIPLLYIITFLLAVVNAFFNTCITASVPRLVYDHKLVKINSWNKAIDSGCSILGPVLAGMIFGLVSMNLFLLVNGISFIASAICEMFIDFNLNPAKYEKPAEDKISLKAIYKDQKEVLHFIKETPLLSVIMPFSISANFILSMSVTVVLPYLINHTLGMSSSQYGMIEGSFSAGMLIAAILIGKLPEKEKKRRGLIAGILSMGLCMVFMGIPGIHFVPIPVNLNFFLYVILSVVFAYSLLFVDLPMTVAMQRLIPDHMMGRVMGTITMISAAFYPVGIILAGITLAVIPAYLIFFIGGTYFIAAAMMLARNKIMQTY